VSADIRSRLQATLGTAYTLERELGGGGMSHVFVAEETALRRKVVVKVVPPELSGGVNVERFNREILLAAQLQHPHIVPVLSAGETDGLPYYTMPFVEGDSLRARLSRDGALPIPDTVAILRDVAKALAYAHERGVVHRDIKPDNVLLTGGSATVTDFGIAKAISASRNEGASGTLTQLGTAIGTPTYMSPEQAAGDPETDHRTDIYAFGCMAYELLTGRPPFTDQNPRKLLAAQMSETPAAVRAARPETPPALADLVTRCLEKDPAARPQQSADLVRALESVATGTHSATLLNNPAVFRRALIVYAVSFIAVAILARVAIAGIGLPDWVFSGALILMALGLPALLWAGYSRTSWHRVARGGVATLGAFALLVAAFMALRTAGIGPMGSLFAKGVIKQSDQLLVMDFESPPADSTLGGVVSEGIRTGLAQSRALRVVDPTAVAAALRRMEKPANMKVTADIAKELAEREGIKAIVDGKVTPVGTSGSYIVTARVMSAAGEQLVTDQETAKDATDLIPAIDRTARALRGKLGESLKSVRGGMALQRATTASLPALRKYSEGARANGEQNYPKAIAALEDAIKLDSTFALAYRTLSIYYNNAGIRNGRTDSLRTRAFELRDRLPDLERALVESNYYFRGGSHADRAKALAAAQRAMELDSTSVSAISSLELVSISRRDYARADSLSKRLQRAGSPFGFTNAAQSEVSLGKTDEAMATIAEYERRFPKSPSVGFAGLAEWAALKNWDSVTAMSQRAVRSPAPQMRAEGIAYLAYLALVRGRPREAAARLEERRRANELAHVGEDPIPIRLLLIAYQTQVLDQPAAALRSLDSLASAAAAEHRSLPRLQIARAYAAAGAPDKAREYLASYDAEVRDTARLRVDGNNRRFTAGRIALAEKKYLEAIALLWSADTLYDGAPADCESCMVPEVARTYDAAGRVDEAIAMLERYAHDTYSFRFINTDPLYLGPSLERLAQLYERKGVGAKAEVYYKQFIDLWKNAEPELQPRVADARRRLAKLGRVEERARH
jgi:tetratricopeptide (TPR) repeat protein